MVCLLGGPLDGHGAFLVGSADAGALGILARDHAHTFATMANIAARPGMLRRSLQLQWLPLQGHRASFVPKGALEFVGLVGRYSPSLLADRYRAMVVMHVTNELPIISPAALMLLPRPGVQSSPPKRR
jgi:hypothetical protein